MATARDLITGHTIGKPQEIPLDSSKIQRHTNPINGIELYLTEWHLGRVVAYVYLHGFSEYLYPVQCYRSNEEARRKFSNLVEKFRRGEYQIDIYGDRKVNVRLL